VNYNNKCLRETCTRLRWQLDKPYCSSTCHFSDISIQAAKNAVVDSPNSEVASEWYAAAVLLSDAINDVTRLRDAYRQERSRLVANA
jgi:hypothetical protein